MNEPTLTVLIPAYNEAPTIVQVLDAVAAVPLDIQVVVIDDGSRDGTAEAVEEWIARTDRAIEVVRHPVNRGKGAAIRSGLKLARGAIAIVQDADLEYDPAEYPRLIGPIVRSEADTVYGSRYLRPAGLPWGPNRVCVLLLNVLVRLLYGQSLTDEATCYKAVRTELLRRLDLRCERFEFCPEVTAKLCRMGVQIHEVPIAYAPRTRREGKKIRWKDGIEAVATLFRWRLAPFRPRSESEVAALEAFLPAHERTGS